MATGPDGREAGAIVIAHGSDATDHAKEYLQNGADFVLVGEAEQSLVELCASILSWRRAAPTNISGRPHLDAQRQPGAELGQAPTQSELEEPVQAGARVDRSRALPAGMGFGSRSLLHQCCRQPWMPLPLQLVR